MKPAARLPHSLARNCLKQVWHKNRKEARTGEPVVTKSLGNAPKTFTNEQKKLWREFARMVLAGVATYADRWGVELIVGAMTKFRAGTAKSADLQQLSAMLSRFGLTPADRSRVVATFAPKPDDEWSDLDEPQ